MLVEAVRRRKSRHVAGIRKLLSCPETITTEADLDGLHPAHAAYVRAEHMASAISEQISALEETAPLTGKFVEAEDVYMPKGPPWSPLTSSYFLCWGFFDSSAGPAHETFGSLVLDLGAAFGTDPELLRVVGLMQDSRMGVYVEEGPEGDLVSLRDLVTGASCRAVVPAGHRGAAGELWFARVLPPPLPGTDEHVVFTTPYVLLQPERHEWEAYFRRHLPDAPPEARLDAYENHMKRGPAHDYWNEFVFEAYVNYVTEAVFLAGLPDVPESRPHSEANPHRF